MSIGVIAFHGDMLPFMDGAKRLREDMGNPSYVDYYFRGHNVLKAYIAPLRFDKVYLVGYSRGGQLISTLANAMPYHIIGACVYEAPVRERPRGNFPVLQLWNEGSNRRHWNAAEQSRTAWGAREDYQEVVLPNDIGHMKGWLRHGFDTRANSLIRSHIAHCKIKQQKKELQANGV